ncbi:MAG TPA: hypothetical protein VGD67_25230 [Pseudonocardiaceae bacterium]
MKIIISGWTAAGKSTTAGLLAADLGWPCLRMTTIMRSLVRSGATPDQPDWLMTDDETRRRRPDLDRLADDAMTAAMARNPNAIVDAWLQPWLYSGSDALRIWLRSDFPSRLAKATVSTLRTGQSPDPGLAGIVVAKDRFSERLFRQLYGIRFGCQAGLFDLVLDNSRYIAEATVTASDTGISRFHAHLRRQLPSELGIDKH